MTNDDEKWVDYVPRRQAKPGNGVIRRDLPLVFLPELGPVRLQDRLVRGVIGEGVLAMMYGEAGCGKSFVAFDLGMHVALGWPWLDHKVTPGAVLYVAAEGAGGWANRAEAFCSHYSVDQGAKDRVPFAFVLAAVNLGPDRSSDVDRIIQASADLKERSGEATALIAIDTLARATPGGNENDSVHVGEFIAKCDAIRQGTGAAVLIIHHAGKNLAAGARGHSALRAAVDCELEVERSHAGRLVRIKKARDGQDGTEIGFKLVSVEVGRDEDGQPITSCVVQAADLVATAKAQAKARWQLALSALDATLTDFPEEPPNRRRYPTNCTLTQVERFKAALVSRSLIDGETEGGRRSQWRNIKNSLISRGFLCIENGLCWRPVP